MTMTQTEFWLRPSRVRSSWRGWLGRWIALLFLWQLSERAWAGAGDTVIVVYNRSLPESKAVAEYYAERRHVPEDRLFGFDLPSTEEMTRSQYRDKLEKPLFEQLIERKLFTMGSEVNGGDRAGQGRSGEKVVASAIRYAALCYGVPVRILNDPKVQESAAEKMIPELRRNEAAVDSEVAVLPQRGWNSALVGPLPNGRYRETNAAALHPTNGLLMVSRLDGPTAEIARGLVDKAIEAEADGLWGRAYYDARGLTNGNYKAGDDWIRGAAQIARRMGFETVLDELPGTFSMGYPMSHIALYAGWYEGNVSGPFTLPVVEFMPGAIGYHLHSFSAQSIRSTKQFWVGPLLDKGVTATMGCTSEPYLEATPDIAALTGLLIVHGFSFGEAAYACQNVLSWQTTVIGDPLYRPFGRKPQVQHEDLARRHSKLIEWSHLKVVNLNQATEFPVDPLIEYLEQRPETRLSAVMTEKLADLLYYRAKFTRAIEAYRSALKLEPSRQQRVRLMLSLGRTLALFDEDQDAFEVYQQFLKQFPDYPEPLQVYQRLLPLAQKLKKTDEIASIQRQIDRLSQSGAAASVQPAGSARGAVSPTAE